MVDSKDLITRIIRDEERRAWPFKTKLRVLVDHIGDISVSYVAHTIATIYASKKKMIRRVAQYGLTISVVVDLATKTMAGMLIDDSRLPGWVLTLMVNEKKVVENMPMNPRMFFGYRVWSCLESAVTPLENSIRYGGVEDYVDDVEKLNVWAQVCGRCGQDSAFFGPSKCKMCVADEMGEALIEEERVQKNKKVQAVSVPKAIDFVIDADEESLEALGFVFNEILVR